MVMDGLMHNDVTSRGARKELWSGHHQKMVRNQEIRANSKWTLIGELLAPSLATTLL